MSYFFLGYSFKRINQRLFHASPGLNKLHDDSKKIQIAATNTKHGIIPPISKMGEEKPIGKTHAVLIRQEELANRVMEKVKILVKAQKLLQHRYTYFQRQTESRWRFFKSFIPFTAENYIRKDISASIQILEKKFSSFTQEVQQFSNKGLRAKL